MLKGKFSLKNSLPIRLCTCDVSHINLCMQLSGHIAYIDLYVCKHNTAVARISTYFLTKQCLYALSGNMHSIEGFPCSETSLYEPEWRGAKNGSWFDGALNGADWLKKKLTPCSSETAQVPADLHLLVMTHRK